MDDSDPGGPIDGGRIGLRTLSCLNRVVVRVHSGRIQHRLCGLIRPHAYLVTG